MRISGSIEEAYTLGQMNGNTLWRDAITKETKNVSVVFEILEYFENLPVGYQPVICHLIFDMKMDFIRKVRYVLDGNDTEDPIGSNFAGVVSRESICIAFTYVALNGIGV